MSAAVLELEQAQHRKLQGLEDATHSAEWLRAEEPTVDPVLQAQRLAVEGQDLMKALADLCDDHWGLAITGAIKDIPAAVQRLRRRLDHAANLLVHTRDLAQSFAGSAEHPIPALEEFVNSLRNYPLWVEETLERWSLLQRRPRPIDPEAAARAREEFQRGECEDVTDILARLNRGGPLLKE